MKRGLIIVEPKAHRRLALVAALREQFEVIPLASIDGALKADGHNSTLERPCKGNVIACVNFTDKADKQNGSIFFTRKDRSRPREGRIRTFNLNKIKFESDKAQNPMSYEVSDFSLRFGIGVRPFLGAQPCPGSIVILDGESSVQPNFGSTLEIVPRACKICTHLEPEGKLVLVNL